MSDQRTGGPPPLRQRLAWTSGFGLILGAAGGALLGADLAGKAALLPGAAVGGLLLALTESLVEWRKQPRLPRSEWSQVFPSAFTGAIWGALLGAILPNAGALLYAILLGLWTAVATLDLRKLVLGTLLGALLGWLASAAALHGMPALLGAAIAPLYRLLAAALFPQEPMVKLIGERVRPEEARFVVPFEAHSKQVGADYFRDLARQKDGTFKRNAPGIGIVATLDALRGPTFDPALVDPLIREFYEHTSRFKLDIVPKWRRRVQPLFWLFKRLIAQPMGQANLPFNTREAQRGIVSYIDTLDLPAENLEGLRGWVRAFEATGEAIYVGIYTTFRHDERGYVSVGFPLPESNFTATLLPHNLPGGGLLLTSHGTALPYPGHYLTVVDESDGSLSVMKLPTFREEIEVYLRGGQLKTDHRFYVSALNFLTLFYTMQRIEVG